MMAPGAHFVSSNAVSSSSRNTSSAGGGGTDVAPTVSFFVDMALRQVVIRRWDAQEELLLPLEDPDEVWHSLLNQFHTLEAFISYKAVHRPCHYGDCSQTALTLHTCAGSNR